MSSYRVTTLLPVPPPRAAEFTREAIAKGIPFSGDTGGSSLVSLCKHVFETRLPFRLPLLQVIDTIILYTPKPLSWSLAVTILDDGAT